MTSSPKGIEKLSRWSWMINFRIRKSNYCPYQSDKNSRTALAIIAENQNSSFFAATHIDHVNIKRRRIVHVSPIGHQCRTVIDMIDHLLPRIRRATVQCSKSLTAQSRFRIHRSSSFTDQHDKQEVPLLVYPCIDWRMIHGTSEEIVWARLRAPFLKGSGILSRTFKLSRRRHGFP